MAEATNIESERRNITALKEVGFVFDDNPTIQFYKEMISCIRDRYLTRVPELASVLKRESGNLIRVNKAFRRLLDVKIGNDSYVKSISQALFDKETRVLWIEGDSLTPDHSYLANLAIKDRLSKGVFVVGANAVDGIAVRLKDGGIVFSSVGSDTLTNHFSSELEVSTRIVHGMGNIETVHSEEYVVFESEFIK